MRRLLLVLVALAAVASPSVRARVRPHVQWLLDPIYEWSTGPKVNDIAREIQTAGSTGQAVPSSDRELGTFLRGRYHQEEAVLDPWGTPYFLTREMAGVRITSAGRDGVPRTADDIASEPISLFR
jgi:hypothetical protein